MLTVKRNFIDIAGNTSTLVEVKTRNYSFQTRVEEYHREHGDQEPAAPVIIRCPGNDRMANFSLWNSLVAAGSRSFACRKKGTKMKASIMIPFFPASREIVLT